MERTDEQLLLACRRGEEAAWEALVRRYQRLIYAIPRRAGLDEDAAAEVFQEVFTTLLENVEGIEQPSRLHAWLVTTARRKTWRVISRAKATRPFGGEDDAEDEMNQVADERPLADEALEQLEEQHLVRAALEGLDERCRKLLTMLFYRAEPPSYSEIAAALGTPEGSIGPTRARCLRKLLEALRKKGFG
jgi:RNA polymerase sigma factor (sigma-70 family)